MSIASAAMSISHRALCLIRMSWVPIFIKGGSPTSGYETIESSFTPSLRKLEFMEGTEVPVWFVV
jgi:hypothetical protein